MLDAPSLGVLASRNVLEESRTDELLEEIDEDDITGIAASLSETSSPFRLSTFFVAVPFLTFYFYELVTMVFLWFVVKWRLRVLIHALKTLGKSAQKANRALLERELMSFGLGLSSLRIHSTCRLRLFLCCRQSVHLLSALSKRLVSENFMSEEKGRLLSTFYNDEMHELIYADVSLDSSHITQRGIGRKTYEVTYGMLMKLFRILDETLTATEVKMALQRVLLMRCLSDLNPNLSPKNKCTTVEHEKTFCDRLENVVLPDDCSDATRPDEVFEAIASPDDINEDDSNLMVSDECVRQRSRELMQELRLALADRASELAERERRALAAFYGAVDGVSHQPASMARSEEVLQQEVSA
uniref:Vezatin n=1 Tax=Angiostrongylus cantonensis TaxID=6313 RepID=A0A158P7Z4_ANGCA